MSRTYRVVVYKRFERFWHWTQALLILALAATGLEVHYPRLDILGFERAVRLHGALAWALVILIAFAVFWHLTTGEWRQYQPTRRYLRAMIAFYLVGIFSNAPHPVKKTLLSKLNPLQRLAYLGLKLLIIPVMVTSGFVYLFYNELAAAGFEFGLGTVAKLHTLGAFLLIAFVIAHVYLTTTGDTPLTNIKAMIVGWEAIEDEPVQRGSDRS